MDRTLEKMICILMMVWVVIFCVGNMYHTICAYKIAKEREERAGERLVIRWEVRPILDTDLYIEWGEKK